MNLGVIGAGWAGCAAAVEAVDAGARVTLFEAARMPGGRARRVDIGGQALDNGQHILIGAYAECLRLMRRVGVPTADMLLRLPLQLHFPDGVSLRLPRLPAPWHVVAGMLRARGLSGAQRRAFLAASLAWKRNGWRAAEGASVAQLAAALPPRVRQRFIDLLCLSALNTPAEDASAQVFLNVLRDSLGAARGASDFLLPRTDLSTLFPQAACGWLAARGARVRLGARVLGIAREAAQWRVRGAAGDAAFDDAYDALIVATPLPDAARLLPALAPAADGMRHEPITTVYVQASGVRLPAPLLALNDDAMQPAQFVFDRGQLGNAPGLLAFVASASSRWLDWDDAQWLQAARTALAQWAIDAPCRLVKVITEKRATFACTPRWRRPAARIDDRLWLAGDYVQGPYPSTLEGAVRSGIAAAHALAAAR
jgi:squalene-associated FAD-dependent desaturase